MDLGRPSSPHPLGRHGGVSRGLATPLRWGLLRWCFMPPPRQPGLAPLRCRGASSVPGVHKHCWQGMANPKAGLEVGVPAAPAQPGARLPPRTASPKHGLGWGPLVRSPPGVRGGGRGSGRAVGRGSHLAPFSTDFANVSNFLFCSFESIAKKLKGKKNKKKKKKISTLAPGGLGGRKTFVQQLLSVTEVKSGSSLLACAVVSPLLGHSPGTAWWMLRGDAAGGPAAAALPGRARGVRTPPARGQGWGQGGRRRGTIK